jgi:ubiquinone/menaquinone biosynthesis C-methylase UbiE
VRVWPFGEKAIVNEYIFHDVDDAPELERLRAIERVFDPDTKRLLSQAGLVPGKRFLEIGAGAGSIAQWASVVVGDRGHVVAVDTNIQYLRALDERVELVEKDFREVHLEPANFDVVHARYVLIHNTNPEDMVRAIAKHARPGTCVVLEEPDPTTLRC